MDFWYDKPFLITKLFKPQILCIHGESPNKQFLLPHPGQIKHLKQNQHLSHGSEFPYLNAEHKLGHKHCLLWSNSSRKKNLNYSDERMDRRHLISFPRCHNTQQLADWFFKSKLQQHQQQHRHAEPGCSLVTHCSAQQMRHTHNPSTADIQERRRPQDVRFQRQAASSPCWVRRGQHAGWTPAPLHWPNTLYHSTMLAEPRPSPAGLSSACTKQDPVTRRCSALGVLAGAPNACLKKQLQPWTSEAWMCCKQSHRGC